MFNAQYDRTGLFTAHHQGRILASAIAKGSNVPVYLTGANDNSINVWDIQECIAGQRRVNVTSNGESTANSTWLES
jgi:di- and tripeptidase